MIEKIKYGVSKLEEPLENNGNTASTIDTQLQIVRPVRQQKLTTGS
jgi:hypothetical protein